MPYAYVIASVVGIAVGVLLGAYLLSRRMQGREPHASFLRLRTRQKVVFFKRLVSDRRVPMWIKAVPFALALYLAMPFDLIPDFIPVLGYLDDVAFVVLALATVMKFTPRDVIDELLQDLLDPARSDSAES
jgi:uncharacterized membrane protein YkvA (DUF1232 family)